MYSLKTDAENSEPMISDLHFHLLMGGNVLGGQVGCQGDIMPLGSIRLQRWSKAEMRWDVMDNMSKALSKPEIPTMQPETDDGLARPLLSLETLVLKVYRALSSLLCSTSASISTMTIHTTKLPVDPAAPISTPTVAIILDLHLD